MCALDGTDNQRIDGTGPQAENVLQKETSTINTEVLHKKTEKYEMDIGKYLERKNAERNEARSQEKAE